MTSGIPFIGENGYYPRWAKGSGRWVFQRTLISVGGMMAGIAELSAELVSTSKHIIVWAPPQRGLLARFSLSKIHRERENALDQLSELHLLCYLNECQLKLESPLAVRKFVREHGIRPEQWELTCPKCGGTVGPALAPINASAILSRWTEVGRPALDDPGASAIFASASPVTDLPAWVQRMNPSHLELAYLGQQMWPSIHAMLKAMVGHA